MLSKRSPSRVRATIQAVRKERDRPPRCWDMEFHQELGETSGERGSEQGRYG